MGSKTPIRGLVDFVIGVAAALAALALFGVQYRLFHGALAGAAEAGGAVGWVLGRLGVLFSLALAALLLLAEVAVVASLFAKVSPGLAGMAKGARRFLGFLAQSLLFPWLWLRSWRFAGRHQGTDRSAHAKVAVAIVVGVALMGGVVSQLVGVEGKASDGFYKRLDDRVKRAVGEAAYEEGNQTKDAAVMAKNQAGHDLYTQTLKPLVAARDDGGLQSAVAAAAQRDASDPANLYPGDMEERVGGAFWIKANAERDLAFWLNWFLYPSAVGMLLAPLAWAQSNVLKSTFEPSGSVGFKPYPGLAASLFLAFGAFGVPSLFFAAWTFQDLEGRSAEGQIAL